MAAKDTVPLAILGVVIALMLLNQAGYIDLPAIGQQIKAVFQKPAEIPSGTVKLDDGTVNKPYEDGVEVTNNENRNTSEDFYYQDLNPEHGLPPGLELAEDGTISGVPTKAGTYIAGICGRNYEYDVKDCNNFSITIKPEGDSSPYVGPCPTKPNPPCGSQPEGKGDLMPTAVGTLTYDYCKCPEGTHDSGGRDAITTPGTVYMMCTCD